MNAPVVFLDPILTSLRENRLVMERLIQWKKVEPGLIHSVTDCAVYALALGLVSHTGMIVELERLGSGHAPVTLTDRDGSLVIDAGGRHAWIVAEAALDVAVDAFRRFEGTSVTVVNVAEPRLLGVVSAIAQKHGLVAKADIDGKGDVTVTIAAGKVGAPSVLDRIRREGVPAKRAEWFELFRLSSNALAEDTPVSRTHTGAYMVMPDGTIVGRNDNEAVDEDITLMTREKLEFRR